MKRKHLLTAAIFSISTIGVSYGQNTTDAPAATGAGAAAAGRPATQPARAAGQAAEPAPIDQATVDAALKRIEEKENAEAVDGGEQAMPQDADGMRAEILRLRR